MSQVADKAKQENDLMLTIFELVKNGANPTIKSASGQQAKHLALIIGFELGVLLLGKTSTCYRTTHYCNFYSCRSM